MYDQRIKAQSGVSVDQFHLREQFSAASALSFENAIFLVSGYC